MLLENDWFYQAPIDFEHKQYKFFAYLKEVDEAFYGKIFSPYLLHTEKLVEEMKTSYCYIDSFQKSLIKKSIFWSVEGLYIRKEAPTMKELETVVEILEFCIPLAENRVDLGRKLHKKFPGILF
jgi:hypothetical protein